jgi:hypothetical protein
MTDAEIRQAEGVEQRDKAHDLEEIAVTSEDGA